MRMSTKILFSLGAHINRYSYYNNSKCTAILMCQNPLPSIYILKKKKKRKPFKVVVVISVFAK